MNAVSDFHYTIWTVQIMQDKIIIVKTGLSEILAIVKRSLSQGYLLCRFQTSTKPYGLFQNYAS